MKKIGIFLLVLCLGLHTPALLAQASGGEDMEETEGQESIPSDGVQGQNDGIRSSEEIQEQQSESTSAEGVKGTEVQPQSAAQELPEKAAPGEKLPGKEVAESILGRIAQAEKTDGETTGVTADENPGDEIMSATGDSIGITAPSAVLMEASTGTVVLEKNSHEKLHPASEQR